jgi:LPXTG-motif cell wall-anchored protein
VSTTGVSATTQTPQLVSTRQTLPMTGNDAWLIALSGVNCLLAGLLIWPRTSARLRRRI